MFTRINVRDLSRRGVVLFFVVLTLVGLVAGASYSLSTDEDAEYDILKANIAEYACCVFGEESALYRMVDNVKPISESVEIDHGISAYYAAAPLFLLCNRCSRYALMLAWHTWTFLLFMMGVAALYFIARELFSCSRRFGCAASLLLYLTPRMFAAGHYNNKDIVLLSLTLLVFLFGIRMVKHNQLRDAVLFSIVGAFAANTKIIGAWMWGLWGLSYLVIRIAQRRLDGKTWRCGLTAIAVFCAGYAALTPAMWSDPVGFFQYLIGNATHFSRWRLLVLFEGRVVSTYSGEVPPWYYLPKLICMTTPVPVLVLTAAGAAAMFFRLARPSADVSDARCTPGLLLIAAIAGAVPLTIGMFSDMVVYNGWRHFYFVYASMLLLAIYALHLLFRVISSRKRMKRVAAGLLAVYFGYHGAVLALNHPLQGSYYNPIAAPFAEENYETDYWLLSTGPAIHGLLNNPDRNPELELTYTACPFIAGIVQRDALALPKSDAQFTTNLNEANYYIEYTMYGKLFEKTPDDLYDAFSNHFFSWYNLDPSTLPGRDWNQDGAFRELFTLSAYGLKIATIYERIS